MVTAAIEAGAVTGAATERRESRAAVPTEATMAATVVIFALMAAMSAAVTARNERASGAPLGQLSRV